MQKYKEKVREGFFVLIILLIAFFLNLFLEELFQTRTLIPMIFVLGIFIISLNTQGYFWGIASSLISVLAVNYAFTYPYYAFDLITPECVSSAVVMLIVAIMTGALTTQLKQQEKLKSESQMERMRANLLRAVSHDLRTPLTSIYGASSAIIDNYDFLEDDQKLKLLGDIQKDSEWLTRMVENLLSVTRINTEDVRIAKSPTVLEELIDAVLVKFRKHCPEHDVTVTIPEDFITIPMDAMLIEQVLINILENAVYHAKGMTELSLTVHTENDMAIFEITDNGQGIPNEKLPALFVGYAGAGLTPTDGTRRNMGIGLSVCSTIISAHNGNIWARNRKEGGAVFGFSLKMEDTYE